MGTIVKKTGINPMLYPILLEKSLRVLQQPEHNYSLLGSGMNGTAYLSGGRVYKITTDKSEAVESNKLVGKTNSHIANIFNTKKINNKYVTVPVYIIVLEYLNTKRSNIFKEIQTSLIKIFERELNIHLFDLVYYYRFDPTTYKNQYEQEIYRILDGNHRDKYYYDQLLEIVDELKANNIESIDLQYFNLGTKPNGMMAFFDMGLGDEQGDLGSIEIDERIKTYMANSSAVKVKKNCQLAGNGNTSDACDQGDIKNLELTKMNEHTSKWNKIRQKKAEIEKLVEFELESIDEIELSEGIQVYHGTMSPKFDNFSSKKIGSSNNREMGGWGIYFSSDPNVARQYGNNILNAEIPNGSYLDLDGGVDDQISQFIVNYGSKAGLPFAAVEQFKSDFISDDYINDTSNYQVLEWLKDVLADSKKAMDFIAKAGFIGTKFSDKTNRDATNYVIFDPRMAKIINNDDSEDMNEQDQNDGFDLKTFDTQRSFSARKRYADSKLQKIGAGSSRIVYLMPDGKVLKLASNVKGLDQNREECGLGQDNYFSTIVANVYDCHGDDQWIVSEYAKKVSPNRFRELTGADIKNVGSYLRNFQEENKGRNGRPMFHIDPAVKEQMDENDFVRQLTEMMQSYALEAGDLGRLASYGEVSRNGQPDIVVSDYGLTTDVYKTHYDKSAKRNMFEEYFGMNEQKEVEINTISKEDIIHIIEREVEKRLSK